MGRLGGAVDQGPRTWEGQRGCRQGPEGLHGGTVDKGLRIWEGQGGLWMREGKGGDASLFRLLGRLAASLQ